MTSKTDDGDDDNKLDSNGIIRLDLFEGCGGGKGARQLFDTGEIEDGGGCGEFESVGVVVVVVIGDKRS
ncbi:hypothetical protein DERP_007205 [Dermatophagoides pteronyssinus]|uniref:Uncharacterized protein n=1 Tax=Dermatophagoides pteronyssinus TaxID=6956 RepID=A0ABQ8J3R8_DERPT|nr:hypothetical protein DERP_007205 [Dermatophagoides pteronyssinus]